MNNEIPITIGFNNAGLPSGQARLSDEAKKIFEDMHANGATYVLAPAFKVKKYCEDGAPEEVELIELSLIPAMRSVKR